MFSIYFEEGFRHLLMPKALDHIAYLVALSVGFSFKRIKALLFLVTAFTIGHSLTLALSSLNYILFPSEIIEFLIPVTIFLTALSTYFTKADSKKVNPFMYIVTFSFGLIHGSGFSNQFKAIMGRTANIFEPLVAFNLGVEIAQIIIVAIVLLLTYIFVNVFGIKHKIWKTILAILAILISILLIKQTWPF